MTSYACWFWGENLSIYCLITLHDNAPSLSRIFTKYANEWQPRKKIRKGSTRKKINTKKEPEVVNTKKKPEVVNTKKEPEVVNTKKEPEVVNTTKETGSDLWPLTFDPWPLTFDLLRKKIRKWSTRKRNRKWSTRKRKPEVTRDLLSFDPWPLTFWPHLQKGPT